MWGVAIILMAIVTPADRPAPGPFAISASLAAHPRSYSGRCPAKFDFDGLITVPRAGLVTYRFIRSDGGAEHEQLLRFDAEGSQSVHLHWELGDKVLWGYEGWVAIQILEPKRQLSAPAGFSFRCSSPAPRRPSGPGNDLPPSD